MEEFLFQNENVLAFLKLEGALIFHQESCEKYGQQSKMKKYFVFDFGVGLRSPANFGMESKKKSGECS